MKGRYFVHEKQIEGEIISVYDDRHWLVEVVRISDGNKLYQPYWTRYVAGPGSGKHRSIFIFDRKSDAIRHQLTVAKKVDVRITVPPQDA